MSTTESVGLSVVEIGIDDPRWRLFTKDHPDATIFHSPMWVRVLAETYNMRGFALAIVSGTRIVGLLPVIEVGGGLRARRWVSLPFTDVCSPLLGAEVDESSLGLLLDAARHDAGVVALDLHAGLQGFDEEQHGFEHILPLETDPNVTRERFKKQLWQQIRQAERKGITARIATDSADLVKTYYGLHVETRRRLGVPTQPRAFFEHLWETILEPGDGFLLLAEHDGVAAGGAVFLAGSPTLIYKYSASLPSFWALRPNNLMLWAAVKWGCENGCTRLHFGRTDSDNPGLRAFKAAWGGEERPLFYSRVGSRPSRGRVPALGGVVSFAIRKSPPIVCRALGAAFYRFAA
jgi:CelD/BcsL family acetyltransferase involved in cellulose biosynthesis